VGLEGEMRTRDNVSTTSRWSVGVDANYKLLPWLKASAGYTFLYDNNEKLTYHTDGTINKEAHFWAPRHRFQVSLTADYDIGNFNLSLRERWQYTYRPEKTISERYDYDQEDYDGEQKTYSGKGKNVLRSRVQLEYKIPNCSLRPYISAEAYNAWSLQKMRYTIGTDWKINKQHSIGVFYRYQTVNKDDDDYDTGNMHILGIGYKLKF